jgi:four helix bundle protein
MQKSNENPRRKFDLEDRLVDFAVNVLDLVESLPETRACMHLGGQLLRSGTSPALNYGEAQSAESRKDFVHKLKVILKELRESSICLRIMDKRSLLKNHEVLNESKELVAIFTKSVQTAESK